MAGIFLAWKRQLLRLLQASWCVNFIVLYLWCVVKGWEFGFVYWLLFSALFAWIFVLVNRQVKPRNSQEYMREFKYLGRYQVYHAVGTFLVSVPMSMLVCCCFCLLLIQWMPASQTNSLVFSALLFPILWAVVCYWVCASSRLFKPFIQLLCILGISVLTLYIGY